MTTGRCATLAPVSTTGILGVIIQMWMLLLENTRSRVEALSSTVDETQNTVWELRIAYTRYTEVCLLFFFFFLVILATV